MPFHEVQEEPLADTDLRHPVDGRVAVELHLNGTRPTVVLLRNGDPVDMDRIDLARQKARAQLAERWEGLVNIPRAELEKTLLRLAIQAEGHKANRQAESESGQGQPVTIKAPEPWPEAVSLEECLYDLRTYFTTYVHCPEESAVAVALWTALTFVYDAFEICPLLVFTSATKRCGKTTALSVLAAAVCRPVFASNVTPSAAFRLIDAQRPTLVLDEAETFLSESEEWRGIVNAGHTKATAWVIRCVGDDFEPRQFSTWCPKVLAGIAFKTRRGTIEDRSIIVRLERKPHGVKLARFGPKGRAQGHIIARKLTTWAQECGKTLQATDPDVPGVLHDRAADNWRPLLAIADAAGGDWPQLARRAACLLAAQQDEDEGDLGVRLLRDIRTVFEAEGAEELASRFLVESLLALPDAPWKTIQKGRELTPNRLATMLSPFGIRPNHGRRGSMYRREDFEDVWERYFPSDGNQTVTLSQFDVSADGIVI